MCTCSEACNWCVYLRMRGGGGVWLGRGSVWARAAVSRAGLSDRKAWGCGVRGAERSSDWPSALGTRVCRASRSPGPIRTESSRAGVFSRDTPSAKTCCSVGSSRLSAGSGNMAVGFWPSRTKPWGGLEAQGVFHQLPPLLQLQQNRADLTGSRGWEEARPGLGRWEESPGLGWHWLAGHCRVGCSSRPLKAGSRERAVTGKADRHWRREAGGAVLETWREKPLQAARKQRGRL